MIVYPFPYKVRTNSLIEDGMFFGPSTFCKLHRDNPKCKAFYRSLQKADGLKRCPFGFCAEIVNVGNMEIIATGMDVETVSDRKAVVRNKHKKDFVPRIPMSVYQKAKQGFSSYVELYSSELETEMVTVTSKADVEEKNQKLDDLLHEMRKLNAQLKICTEDFASCAYNDYDMRNRYATDIYSTSNLMSLRMDTYDFETNPLLFTQSSKIPVPIYKRVEKCYKCLESQKRKKNLHVNLIGNSYGTFSGTSIIELALFIIIENAIKYAPNNTNIDISFSESDYSLAVTFENYGICPLEHELQHLTNRGFRSKRIKDMTKIEGRGLGLYIVNQICALSGIQMVVSVNRKDFLVIDQCNYHKFAVRLKFPEIAHIIDEA